jgi:putative phosphoserine phosphatase/1-acylglycerol-3-phosphate O-acyltransferase
VTEFERTLEKIEAAPYGPDIGAFFDLDGTLVAGYTGGTFYREQIRRREISRAEFVRTLLTAIDGSLLGGDPTKVVDVGFGLLEGHSVDYLEELGERLFLERIAGTIRLQARELVRAHQRRGHTVAVASAATRFQIGPVARDLGIEHILCTELQSEDGIYTGKVDGAMLFGEPKARAVRRFAREQKLAIKESFGYANGDEDIPFLSSVGHPHALNPAHSLRIAARNQGWPILDLRDPKRGGARALVRTVAAVWGMNTGLGVGAATGLLSRDRQRGINTGIGLSCELALKGAGVQVDVIGEDNLWRARPAIFIANHQSSLDPLVVGSLLKRDFTGVGKKEAKYDPRMVLASLVLDPVYIDRSNSTQARGELDKLTERIRSGTSIMIFPEGTRTATQALGPFKKGAFHMAMQAGVPVVPIVLRNTGELMWRRSKLVNAGTVEVAVLDPIPTDDWTVADLNDHVADVHDLFRTTLEQWPSGGTK